MDHKFKYEPYDMVHIIWTMDCILGSPVLVKTVTKSRLL